MHETRCLARSIAPFPWRAPPRRKRGASLAPWLVCFAFRSTGEPRVTNLSGGGSRVSLRRENPRPCGTRDTTARIFSRATGRRWRLCGVRRTRRSFPTVRGVSAGSMGRRWLQSARRTKVGQGHSGPRRGRLQESTQESTSVGSRRRFSTTAVALDQPSWCTCTSTPPRGKSSTRCSPASRGSCRGSRRACCTRWCR